MGQLVKLASPDLTHLVVGTVVRISLRNSSSGLGKAGFEKPEHSREDADDHVVSQDRKQQPQEGLYHPSLPRQPILHQHPQPTMDWPRVGVAHQPGDHDDVHDAHVPARDQHRLPVNDPDEGFDERGQEEGGDAQGDEELQDGAPGGQTWKTNGARLDQVKRKAANWAWFYK